MAHDSKDNDNKLSKHNLNRMLKEANLFDSAYELFGSKGVYDTSIDDIVKKAGVAKGTFYLYFKSKYDIVDRIILKKSFSLLSEAINATTNKQSENLTDSIIYFIDYIIEYFKNNKTLLKIIHKNLSWGIYRKAIANKEQNEEIDNMLQLVKNIINKSNFDEESFEKNLFMIIELTGAVCYSSIILNEPEPIDVMKPAFFKMVSKMVSNF